MEDNTGTLWCWLIKIVLCYTLKALCFPLFFKKFPKGPICHQMIAIHYELFQQPKDKIKDQVVMIDNVDT